MFDAFKHWLGLAPTETLAPAAMPPAANDAAYAPPPAASAPVAPPAEQEPALADFDVVGRTNKALHTIFYNTPVKYNKPYGDVPAIRWLKAVDFDEPKAQGDDTVIHLGSAEPNKIAKLKLTLGMPAGNYDIDSISNVVHAALANIPGLKGHVKPAPDAKDGGKTMGDIWKELEPVLRQSHKFSAAETKLLQEYFTDHAKVSLNWGGWDRIEVSNADKKVQVRINSEEPKGDKKPVLSNDQSIVDFMTTNKAAILKHFKAKLLALKDDKGQSVLTESELAQLDFTAEIKTNEGGWPASLPVIEFGNLVEGKLGETAIHRINTDVLDKAFTETLLACQGHLPDILPRIADSTMVGEMLRSHIGASPALEKALDHNAFKSPDKLAAENEKLEKNNVTILPNLEVITGDKDNPHQLQMTFELPKGLDLPTLRVAILENQQQIVAALGQGQAAGRTA